MQEKVLYVEQIWRITAMEMGIDIKEMLRNARLPENLFELEGATTTTSEFYHLWNAFTELVNDPALPLLIEPYKDVNAMHPVFLGMVSCPNLHVAINRLLLFNNMAAPLNLELLLNSNSTRVKVHPECDNIKTPVTLILVELIKICKVVRIATREHIVPLSVTVPPSVPCIERYSEYFGVPVNCGEDVGISFSSVDANKTFITHNEKMWKVLERELQEQLAKIKSGYSTAKNVRDILTKLLPNGSASIETVAQHLNVSKRTLQRRLKEESTSFLAELKVVREELGKHYLLNTTLTVDQISFMLGFNEVNSFIRAFQNWTGLTPLKYRQVATRAAS